MTSTIETPSPPTQHTTDSRKRKISEVLSAFDRSKFTPSQGTSSDATGTPSPLKQSTFAPWDRTQLISRLASFRSYYNHSPTSPISALSLSRRGWTLVPPASANCIQCVSCRERIIVDVNTAVPGALRELERRYGQMSVDKHKKTCFWRDRECKVRLLRLALADAETSMKQMKARQDTFDCNGRDSSMEPLPEIEIAQEKVSLPENMTLAEKYALTGWSLTRLGSVSLLVCTDCLCRARLVPTQSFKPLREHHAYCPWICAKVQGSAPGWELLRQHYIKTRSKHSIATGSDSSATPASTNGKYSEETPRERVRQVKQKLGFL